MLEPAIPDKKPALPAFKLKRTTSMINIDKEQAKNIEVPEMKENTKEAKPDKIVLRKDPVQIKAPTKK